MIAEPTGTDGHRAVGRSPRTISYRSPLAMVLLSLQAPPDADTVAGSLADTPPLSVSPVFPPPPQRRPGPDTPRRGIPLDQWPEVLRRVEQGETLRQIAHSYGVSHETVRRTLQAAQKRERGGK